MGSTIQPAEGTPSSCIIWQSPNLRLSNSQGMAVGPKAALSGSRQSVYLEQGLSIWGWKANTTTPTITLPTRGLKKRQRCRAGGGEQGLVQVGNDATLMTSLVVLVVKNLPAKTGDSRQEFSSWNQKISWRRARQPTPVFLPGEYHGRRSLVGYSPQSCEESDMIKATKHTLGFYYVSGVKCLLIHIQNLP